MQLEKGNLQKILEQELEGKPDSAGRGVWTVDHCKRTANLALQLRQAVGAPEELDDLLYLAGLFHDVSHDSASHDLHEEAGAKRVCQLLTGKVETTLLQQASAIIRVHDDRRQNDGRSTALHLVQDADMLDHFGTLEIWANFGYAALHGESLQNSLDFYQKASEKREHYMQLLHFDAARQELARKLAFEMQFYAYAARESAGGLTD